VGDFGIGFAGYYWHEMVNDWMNEYPSHRFIRGNHDDPTKCKEMANYIPDGTVEGDVMYIGGAWSIDHALRTPGKDWWFDEELSISELDKLVNLYEKTKPRVMITHDCPTSVAWDMFISTGLSLGGKNQIKTRTGEALQAMFDIHKPDYHFFGHWHVTKQMDIQGTRFVCLGELDYVDVDLDNSEITAKLLNEKNSW
jgi:Icc-related predicted phosphoesterase